jgi:hypothetical protein
MKKLLAIMLCVLFVASFAVIGCKKEEPAPAAEAPAVEAPAAEAPAEAPAQADAPAPAAEEPAK